MNNIPVNKIDRKVRQSNNFVESPYAQEFTATELKILEIAVADCKVVDKILVEKENNKKFEFTTKELAKLLNTSVSSLSHEAERLSQSIIKKYIHGRRELVNGEIEFETIAIIPYTKYESGIFSFELNYKLLPYFIEINEGFFTEYSLRYLMNLKSAYAIKLYKLLFQYRNLKKRKFAVNELKNQFGINDKKYKLYSDFKRRILDLSVDQINQFTDLDVTYNEIKVRSKISELEFLFKVKNIENPRIENNDKIIDHKDYQYNNELSSIYTNLKHGISDSTKTMVSKFYEEKGIEYIESSIEYAQKNAKTNFDKYLQDTLANNWAEAMIKKNIAIKEAESKKIAVENQQKTKKQLELEQDQLNKMQIENEWFKLPHDMQKQYNDFLNVITKKHAVTLTKFPKWNDVLLFCIYAVSTNRTYDSILEGYFHKQLNQSLTIDKV